MTDNQRIRLAEIPPTHCSSCFQQKPQQRHVDFSAFWDGPVFGDQEVAGGRKVVIDDLILCDDCVRAAAELLGFADVEREREEIHRLKSEIQNAQDKLALALAGTEKL